MVSTPGSPLVYEKPQRPIGGVISPQPKIGVPIEPRSGCCGIVPWWDIPMPMWASLGITGGAESELLVGIPLSGESHHLLARRQLQEVVEHFDGISFSF